MGRGGGAAKLLEIKDLSPFDKDIMAAPCMERAPVALAIGVIHLI
jgi:hypothetical protein